MRRTASRIPSHSHRGADRPARRERLRIVGPPASVRPADAEIHRVQQRRLRRRIGEDGQRVARHSAVMASALHRVLDGAVAAQGEDRAEVAAEPVARVVDTTGAGDLFAAGFLAGQAEGRSLSDSLTMGAVCAAEVISHYGPRPEADLRALVAARLG